MVKFKIAGLTDLVIFLGAATNLIVIIGLITVYLMS